MNEMLSDFPVKEAGRKAFKLGHPELRTCNIVEMELTCFGKDECDGSFFIPYIESSASCFLQETMCLTGGMSHTPPLAAGGVLSLSSCMQVTNEISFDVLFSLNVINQTPLW